MSSFRALSTSFSSQSQHTLGTQVSRKRKKSQEQHAPRSRRRRTDYRRTDGQEDVDTHLCSRCRTIDFERIFEIEPDETVTEQGINVHDLGELAPFSKGAHCKLCSLFALILKRNEQYESFCQGDWYLRAFTTGTLRNRSHSAASRAQDLSIVIALSQKSDLLSKHERIECIDRGVILPWHDASEPEFNDRNSSHITACSRRIDFGRLKEMLLSCDTNHLKCQERQKKKIPFPVRAKVIDCQSREVVLLTSECSYLALSYVWGPRHTEEGHSKEEQGSKVVGHLPLTIEDAISITEALGLRYLWVDRVCIDQSQSDDTQHQVGQMGSIYSHAYATLCALGDHDDVGFPGVSFDRRRQFHAQTQDLILSWTGPSIRRNLDFAKWRSRGWTYQESVLSRRCLFFTEHFVALTCDSDTSTENVSYNYFHTWSFNKESELYGDATSWGRVLYPAQEFNKHLQEFQRRQLTYVTDTLNAFKGILSQLSVQSYWGVPIYRLLTNQSRNTHDSPRGREQETGLITGLCWKVTKSSHTNAADRDGFPSWSWVGQKYARTFTNCLARYHDMEVAHAHFAAFQAIVKIKGTDDRMFSVQELCDTHAATKIIPEQTPYLEIRSVMIRWQARIDVQSKTNWVEGGLDAYQVGENGWWRSDYIGNLYLDPSYDELTKPHESCGDQNQICRHLPLKSGMAILLALSVKQAGNHTAARGVWLVVKQIRGGSYRRKGIIVSSRSVKSRSPITCPTDDMLETILLG